jgi:dTDP-4-dehydrorhamnose 3,5-epimerase
MNAQPTLKKYQGKTKTLIAGVQIKELKKLPDDRGWLMELMRSDWPEFQAFGQVYITCVYPGIVKAWHYHEKQRDAFIGIAGMAKIVLWDGRKDSPTCGAVNEFFTGVERPLLVTIPPFVMHGFTAVGHEPAQILNVCTELYNYADPDEFRAPADDPGIPYDWFVSKHG